MPNNIIKLNLATKIQYSLFNLFAPISVVAAFICSFDLFNFKSTLFGFLSILVGLFCLIFNLFKYNKYIIINNDSMALCLGKMKNPKVLKIIKRPDLQNMQLGSDLTLKNNSEKIKLLHISPSILGLICWIGPLLVIPMLKRNNVLCNKLWEIKSFLPEILIPENIKQPSKTSNVIIEIIMWGFVMFVCGAGCIGVFMMPFYAFMG